MRFPAFKTSASSLRLLAVSGLLMAGLNLTGCSTEEDDGGDGKMIQLTNPKGGETVKEGDSLYISWKVADKDIAEFSGVDPLISLDDGISWNNIRIGSIAPTSPSWGRYGWKVDSIIVGGAKKSVVTTTARFKVQEYSTADAKKISTASNAFTIQAK